MGKSKRIKYVEPDQMTPEGGNKCPRAFEGCNQTPQRETFFFKYGSSGCNRERMKESKGKSQLLSKFYLQPGL